MFTFLYYLIIMCLTFLARRCVVPARHIVVVLVRERLQYVLGQDLIPRGPWEAPITQALRRRRIFYDYYRRFAIVHYA